MAPPDLHHRSNKPATVAVLAAARLVWRAAAPGCGPGVQKPRVENRQRPTAQVVFTAQQRPMLL
jgi:hypothetical protein